MEEENINQQSSIPQSLSQTETSHATIYNQKGNFLILIGVFIFAVIVGGGAYYLGMMNDKSNSSQPTQMINPTNSIQFQPSSTQVPSAKPLPPLSSTQVPSAKPLPPVRAGFQQYTNDSLRYGFSYPISDSLDKCTDTPCLSISRISLRIETLETYELSPSDPKESLMNSDLYCSASGPGGSIFCKNTKVEDFTNSLGFKGFKIFRTKTVQGTGAGFAAGTYQDIVYAYPLPKVSKGPGVLDYAGIMFAVDDPALINLSELNNIENSFFTY